MVFRYLLVTLLCAFNLAVVVKRNAKVYPEVNANLEKYMQYSAAACKYIYIVTFTNRHLKLNGVFFARIDCSTVLRKSWDCGEKCEGESAGLSVLKIFGNNKEVTG